MLNTKQTEYIDMEEITATKNEIQSAFDLWYEEQGAAPDDFSDNYDEASETFIEYLDRVQGKVPA